MRVPSYILLSAEQSSVETAPLYPGELGDGVETGANIVDEAANLEPEDLLRLAKGHFAPAQLTQLDGRCWQ